MKKTTTPLHLFKNESQNTKQHKSVSFSYPSNTDLVNSILSYAKATGVVEIMSRATVLYWN